MVTFIAEHFVPAWESVAEVTTVSYPLSSNRSVEQVLSGEIAFYFCRPDGRVVDILLGLQSPTDTLSAMKEALVLFNQTDNGRNESAVRAFHADASTRPIEIPSGQLLPICDRESLETKEVLQGRIHQLDSQIAGLKRRLRELGDSPDGATRVKRNAKNISSIVEIAAAQPALIQGFVTVVDPAGRNHRRGDVHTLLAANGDGLHSPSELKETVFEELLAMPLARDG